MFEDIVSQYVCPRCGQKLIAKEDVRLVSYPLCASPSALVDKIGCGCAEPWFGITVSLFSTTEDSEITAKQACENYIDMMHEKMERDEEEEE